MKETGNLWVKAMKEILKMHGKENSHPIEQIETLISEEKMIPIKELSEVLGLSLKRTRRWVKIGACEGRWDYWVTLKETKFGIKWMTLVVEKGHISVLTKPFDIAFLLQRFISLLKSNKGEEMMKDFVNEIKKEKENFIKHFRLSRKIEKYFLKEIKPSLDKEMEEKLLEMFERMHRRTQMLEYELENLKKKFPSPYTRGVKDVEEIMERKIKLGFLLASLCIFTFLSFEESLKLICLITDKRFFKKYKERGYIDHKDVKKSLHNNPTLGKLKEDLLRLFFNIELIKNACSYSDVIFEWDTLPLLHKFIPLISHHLIEVIDKAYEFNTLL
jgi:hypothetical protein